MEKRPKADFNILVSGFFAEGMIALGMMQNPLTKKTEKNMDHASYVIDMLEILREKTSGNLNKEESDGMEQGIHQLRMIYIAEINKPPGEKKENR